IVSSPKVVRKSHNLQKASFLHSFFFFFFSSSSSSSSHSVFFLLHCVSLTNFGTAQTLAHSHKLRDPSQIFFTSAASLPLFFEPTSV
ncbi:hypothetical protein Csa_008763, partial [Cucumis sativus]